MIRTQKKRAKAMTKEATAIAKSAAPPGAAVVTVAAATYEGMASFLIVAEDSGTESKVVESSAL